MKSLIKRVEALSLGPNEVLVLRFPKSTRFEEAARARITFVKSFPGRDVIAVVGDMQIDKIRIENKEGNEG